MLHLLQTDSVHDVRLGLPFGISSTSPTPCQAQQNFVTGQPPPPRTWTWPLQSTPLGRQSSWRLRPARLSSLLPQPRVVSPSHLRVKHPMLLPARQAPPPVSSRLPQFLPFLFFFRAWSFRQPSQGPPLPQLCRPWPRPPRPLFPLLPPFLPLPLHFHSFSATLSALLSHLPTLPGTFRGPLSPCPICPWHRRRLFSSGCTLRCHLLPRCRPPQFSEPYLLPHLHSPWPLQRAPRPLALPAALPLAASGQLPIHCVALAQHPWFF
mmetsp:Transcript_56347/g.108709  ORF Transcript_56347/g.108709 Transcript_56347/m.108709 type:complete len:265 (+) Transcript_56347:134-928(+)